MANATVAGDGSNYPALLEGSTLQMSGLCPGARGIAAHFFQRAVVQAIADNGAERALHRVALKFGVGGQKDDRRDMSPQAAGLLRLPPGGRGAVGRQNRAPKVCGELGTGESLDPDRKARLVADW